MAIGSASGLVRRLPEAVGLARAAIGIAHMVAPTRANELLAGPDAAVATTRAAARTFRNS
ncbi:hypothetical protein AB0P23_10100 [Rhodococcus sp. NPDC077669]|uniref:hypothetical protein n=1 Tax=Rhodococcus sp. NPDC077669 TaxID=3155174 RepID=UPI0034125150